MKSTIKFVRPNDAFTPVSTGNGGKAVAGWLGSDIQYSQKSLQYWIEVLKQVHNGEKLGGYLGTGNTHSIMAMKDMVFIESEHIENQKVLTSLEEIFLVLEKYQLFLKSDYKNTTPQEFDFSFTHEGEEALNFYIESGGSLEEL